MKAFITGGAGFIGSSMADRLLLGAHNTVTVFDNFSSGRMDFLPEDLAKGRLNVVIGDLLDLPAVSSAMQGHDFVYHFAANPDISLGARDTSLDFKQSMVSTYNVLESMRVCGVSNLVFASGSGVYGDTGGRLTPEDYAPMLPISMYGAGKLSAEAMISAFSSMFGIKAYVFRLANVVGARQTHGVLFDFINKLRADPLRLTILGNGQQSKSYIHIDDVLDAIFFVVAMANAPLNVFNVGSADNIDVNWIAGMVTEKMNLAGVEIVHSGEERGWPGDIPVVRLDVSKIQKLGWRSRYTCTEALSLAADSLIKSATAAGGQKQ